MSELQQALNRESRPSVVQQWDANMKLYMQQQGQHILRLCGSKEEAGRLYAAVTDYARRVPRLFECDWASIGKCIMHSATLRLLPGPMGECAYIPFGREATFVPMYPGLIKLAYNSGIIRRLSAKVVYAGDEFEYEEGLHEKLRHVPRPHEEGAERIAVYAVAETKFGAHHIAVLWPQTVANIRARSAGAKKPDSPWNSKYSDDVDAMWVKTAVKQLLKYLPRSAEMAMAVDLDNEEERPDLAKPPLVDLAPPEPPKAKGRGKAQVVDVTPEPDEDEPTEEELRAAE